jgi:hypothetical protein
LKKPLISAGCAYYGGASPEHVKSVQGLFYESIPFVEIRGCAYPEMARSHLVSSAMEAGVECLLMIDPCVSFDARDAHELAEGALRTGNIAIASFGSYQRRPWIAGSPEPLALAAIPLGALRAIDERESRVYTNTPIANDKQGRKDKPLFSPWRRSPGTLETIPIHPGEYACPDRAFLHRAMEAGVGVSYQTVPHKLGSVPRYSRRVREGKASLRAEYGAPNYAICVPTFGPLDLDQQRELFELEKAGLSIVELHNCPYIDVARAELTRVAMDELGADGVFFLDHDIMFRPKDALALMREAEERKDVVAAVYCMRKHGHSLIGAFEENGEPIVFFEGGKVRESLYSGLGFAAVPRAVIESLYKFFPKLDAGFDAPVYPLYALDCNGGYYAGEDVSFCSRVHGLSIKHLKGSDGGDDWSLEREASPTGHRVMLDTRVRIFHRGKYDYGIEDHSIGVPRFRSLEGRTCRTREEVRSAIVAAHELATDIQMRTLGLDEGASEPHPIISANEREAAGLVPLKAG